MSEVRMSEERISQMLPILFRQICIPQIEKKRLEAQLFGKSTLSDADLFLVSAVDKLAKQKR
jgi:hypothetical protein